MSPCDVGRFSCFRVVKVRSPKFPGLNFDRGAVLTYFDQEGCPGGPASARLELRSCQSSHETRTETCRVRLHAMASTSPKAPVPPLPITAGVLATAIAVVLGSYLGGKFLLRAWLLSTLSTTLIVVAALGFHHLVVSHQNQPSNFPTRTFNPFAFSAPDKWPSAVRSLRSQSAFRKEFREQLVPGARDISEQ